MTQSFGINVATIDDAGIKAGLDALAQPPDWLVAIEDLTRLRADLERTIPELASGELRLVACKFKRAHVENGTYISLCRLRIEDGDGGSAYDVDVHGVLVLPWMDAPSAPATRSAFAELNWHCFLPDLRWEISVEPTDTALPAMPSLTDPDLSRALLEGAVRATRGDLADIEIAGCTPVVMRYREGRRCTIRYELEYATGRRAHWPAGMIAKVYEGDEGRGTFEAMTALWASPLRESSTVTIAEPLAFISEQSVMVQGLVPGDRSMKEHIKTVFAGGLETGVAALASPVRKAGRGLGELHTSGALVGPVVMWEEQVAAVRHAGDELASVVPHLADAMESLVGRLETLGEVEPAGPLVPTHRSFRPAQILLDHNDIAFIDFDGFCQAEAGLDLALFRTTLGDLSLRALEVDDQPMSVQEQAACQVRLDELCGIFLAGYEEVAEYSPERLALWDALTSAKDILDCWRKIKFEHLERRMRFLHHKLGTISGSA
ncbi:MAG: hypothetical protein ACRDOT_01635 [Aeromicrobium sp.]